MPFDPILPVYYCPCVSAAGPQLRTFDRRTGKTDAWSDRLFADGDVIETIGCPATGRLDIMFRSGGKRYFERLASTGSIGIDTAVFRNQSISNVGLMLTSIDDVFVMSAAGPFRITVADSVADLQPLVTAPVRGGFDIKLFVRLSNGLLLAQTAASFRNDSSSLDSRTASLVVIDPAGFDRMQTVFPFDDRSGWIDSAVCSRRNRDLLYLTSDNRMFEFYLSSDLLMDIRFSKTVS